MAASVPGTSADGQDIPLRHRPRGSPPRLRLLRCSLLVCRPQGPQPHHRRDGHRRAARAAWPNAHTRSRSPWRSLACGATWWRRGAACGDALGSHVTGASTPSALHKKQNPTIAVLRVGERPAMVSQFMVDLLGLKSVDGEDPHHVLHYNSWRPPPWRLELPVEQNTCYRVNWSAVQSCDGWRSRLDEETGLGPCQFIVFICLTGGGFGCSNMLNEFLLMCSGWVGEVQEVDYG